jgi:dTDP-glucose pyrophosphorylase
MSMTSSVQQGVILAAGRGVRLEPLSGIRPKALHPVCNKPIMQYQLEAMREAGIRRVWVVINPQGTAIADYFGDGRGLGLAIDYVLDEAPSGIAMSLARVERQLSGPFAVFLGDIFLVFDDFAKALEPMAQGAAGTIVVRRDDPEAIRRNFAVVSDAEGRVRRVIEKPASPPTQLKGCGVYVFDEGIFEAIRQTPPSALRGEHEITDAIQTLVDTGRPVYAVENVRWDMNINDRTDLLMCNLRVLHENSLDYIVGEGTQLGHGVDVSRSVIGDRVVIDAPVRLEECLVLSDTNLSAMTGVARRQIFANGIVCDA